ncbi:MAG TPA: NAD(P)-dependent oxidoreductase [Polyangiaceae bacterium]|jgi:phosphoglycerate dehydrogenase-like enzyme|nr:NAD(P)-dependent oxidoreductase [Polyangiaceae bacterium]
MRVVLFLTNPVSAFAANSTQISALAARLRDHSLHAVFNEADFLRELPGAEAVVVWRFLPEWYESAPRLRHVCTPAAGRERIAPDPSGRSVRHFGAFHGQIMAESLLAMMLFMNRRLGRATRAQLEREWAPLAYEGLTPLRGQTALLVGYGAIGKHAARLLAAVGVHVHGLKRDKARGTEGAERVFAVDELTEAVALADHVACLLPSDTGSDHLLDERAFEKMKRGAFVYNLGRGNAIDVAALERALLAGQVGGAFLDVVPQEPLPADSTLWTAKNLYLTPHASAIRSDYLDLYFAELGELLA